MERADRKRRAIIALGVLLACCPCASALNPSLHISQYAHNAWKIRDGFFKGFVFSIVQTPDGYLWLGTEFGLFRFDGVRSVPWQPPTGEHLPNSSIGSLLAARDGRLWIGTIGGLASWKDGKLAHYPEFDGRQVGSLIQDRDGTVWFSENSPSTGRLCMIREGTGQSANIQCYGVDGSLGLSFGHLYEDGAGNLWARSAKGLWHCKPGPPKLYPMPLLINDLIEGDNGGTLLISMLGDIKQFRIGRTEAYSVPGVGRLSNPQSLFRDRDGGVWIGTRDRGLFHVHRGRTDRFSSADGLSGDWINAFFEDREGSIWVITYDGLDRFREFAIPTISAREGLSNDNALSVLAAGDGSVWVGTTVGLNHLKDAAVTIYREHDGGLPDSLVGPLFQDDRRRIWVSTFHGIAFVEDGRFHRVNSPPGAFVRGISEDRSGDLWFRSDEGLFRFQDGNVAEEIPVARLGNEGYVLSLLADPTRGGIWLGSGQRGQGGVAYFKDGQIRASFAAADGLGEGRVADLRLDGKGTLWASTAGGLSRLSNGRVSTLTDKNGLPCNTVHWSMEDNEGSVWLYSACGLVRLARTDLDGWAADPKRTLHATIFDSTDGVRATANVVGTYSPRVTKSADGRIWFLRPGGISIIDPRHLSVNKLPPPVHIEQITADRKLRWQNLSGTAASNLRLPALSRDLQIDYTALSFVAPEKVRFRVKLEGHDPAWKDAGNERKAFYNDLPPRHYRFRVMASNNSGVWNEAGDSLDFSIDPAYYQTTWFRASCVAVSFALLWALHLYRLHQIAERFNARLEGRVDERLRVARDLHDTLLQSFHGLMMRFQAAVNLLPGRGADARQVLEAAVDDAAKALTEARDAVQGMRSSTEITNQLSQAVEVLGKSLAEQQRAANGDAPTFSVEVEGESRDLHPILRDEVYRMTGEALRNAFRHARARRVEVEIRYDARELRVRVRDDGIGMDASVLQEGRAGHYGLPGMRERAKSIGGQLEVWSEHGAGTELELTVPAKVAYAGRGGRARWWRRLRRQVRSRAPYREG